MGYTKLKFDSSKYIEEIFRLIENNLTEDEFDNYVSWDRAYDHIWDLSDEYCEFSVVKDIIILTYQPDDKNS